MDRLDRLRQTLAAAGDDAPCNADWCAFRDDVAWLIAAADRWRAALETAQQTVQAQRRALAERVHCTACGRALTPHELAADREECVACYSERQD